MPGVRVEFISSLGWVPKMTTWVQAFFFRRSRHIDTEAQSKSAGASKSTRPPQPLPAAAVRPNRFPSRAQREPFPAMPPVPSAVLVEAETAPPARLHPSLAFPDRLAAGG